MNIYRKFRQLTGLSYFSQKEDLRNSLINASKRADEAENYLDQCVELREKVSLLEKEAVYWKDKALNFRRFHQ